MKKASISTLAGLLCFSGVAMAQDADVTVHMSKISLAHGKEVVMHYTTCESSSPICNKPIESTMIIESDGNAKIPAAELQNRDVYITSMSTKEGKVIWGTYPADYHKNLCGNGKGNTSINFALNSDDTITCTIGMG